MPNLERYKNRIPFKLASIKSLERYAMPAGFIIAFNAAHFYSNRETLETLQTTHLLLADTAVVASAILRPICRRLLSSQ